MKWIKYILILAISVVTITCDEDPFGGGTGVSPATTGVLEVDFKLPYVPLPKNKIHRVDLSIAR